MNKEKLLKRFRNSLKKQYAAEYFDWLRHGEITLRPKRPAGLSLMAEQSVWWEVKKFLNQEA